jgi:NAD+ synthase (glutamine-hydrolysing)
VRVAVGVPHVHVADPRANVEATLALARQASQRRAILAVFPELGLSCYSADDLFHQQAILVAVQDALARLVEASTDLACALVVGAPLVAEGRLFNCAVVVHQGKVVGVVPKSCLPAYREFYEKRQFAAARDALANEITLLGQRVPFDADLLFCTHHHEHFVFHIEICEDLWVPIPPSSFPALAGATVLVNLSASNALVAKADYRRLLCASQSARGIAAYLHVDALRRES